jgi:hypothetical protein
MLSKKIVLPTVYNFLNPHRSTTYSTSRCRLGQLIPGRSQQSVNSSLDPGLPSAPVGGRAGTPFCPSRGAAPAAPTAPRVPRALWQGLTEVRVGSVLPVRAGPCGTSKLAPGGPALIPSAPVGGRGGHSVLSQPRCAAPTAPRVPCAGPDCSRSGSRASVHSCTQL